MKVITINRRISFPEKLPSKLCGMNTRSSWHFITSASYIMIELF